MKKIKILFLLFFCITITVGEFCDKNDDTCRELKKLRYQLKDSQKELNKYKQILNQATCTVCNINGVNPCKNNGTCVILPSDGTSQKFSCDCPDDYAGDVCQTHVECKPDSCGDNAVCTVYNHKTVCTCPFGSTGDPYKTGCKYKTSTGYLMGDPHYSTYDGLLYSYMGTCTYYVTRKCNMSDNDFYVLSDNYIVAYNPHVAYEKSFTVHVYDQDFYVDSSGLQVNHIKQTYNYNWPYSSNPLVSILKSSNGKITVNIPEYHITVFYFSNKLSVILPQSEQFYGKNTMCGALGNIDGDCNDDVKFTNGSIINTNALCNGGGYNENNVYSSFVDSWIIPDSTPGCTKGSTITLNKNCNLNNYQSVCRPIYDAISGQGPFGQCSALGEATIKKNYYACLYDACEGEDKCDSLSVFGVLCQTRIPFVTIDNWRNASNCPYHCEPHSHYSLKSPSCQLTCSHVEQETQNGCIDIPQEGCICDPGYYLDPNVDPESEANYACRLLEDCGCTDEYGNYYLPNTSFMDTNCTNLYTCKNGRLRVKPVNCSSNGKCINNKGEGQCVCNDGYLKYQGDCVLPPIRHCADLYIKKNIHITGIYSVNLGASYDNETLYFSGISKSVYCDMTTDNGGWTLVAGGKMNYTKTYEDYINGWNELLGSRKTNIGLESMYRMTNETETSLRIFIDRCPEDPDPILTECIYPIFKVFSKDDGYAVYIPELCSGGNETSKYADPWVRWDPKKIGPTFATFDNDNWQNCSNEFKNTGWWYDNSGYIGCGSANLFGQRLECKNDDNVPYDGIFWNGKSIDDAFMFARPKSYPDLDE